MWIDNKFYKVSSDNYHKTKNKKKQIILAGSLRASGNHIKRLQKKDYGKSKKWSTYSISREGYIYEHFDPSYYSDFMGIKDIDKKSISIVLENMGGVYFDNETEEWLNWAMEKCPENRVFEKNWKHCRYWEAYTEEQFNSTVQLCKYLCETYNVKLDCLGFNVHHDETHKFDGIVTRSNYDISYNDLNPSFDFKRFLECLDIKY